MEREPSQEIEREPLFEIDEPLTLTKKEYQAALAAVIKSYSKGNTSAPPVGPKQGKKMVGKGKGKAKAKGSVRFNL